MKTNLLLVLTLIAISGCNWDEASVLGRKPKQKLHPDYTSDYAKACSSPYQLLKESEAGVRGCVAPDQVDAVVAEDKGVITLWVTRMLDGQFPAVTGLIYDSYFGDIVITYNCISGRESVDGNLKEITCTSGTNFRLSPVELTSQDHRLMVKTLILKNPSCGKTVTFKRTSTESPWSGCQGYYAPDPRSEVILGKTRFAPVWTEPGAANQAEQN